MATIHIKPENKGKFTATKKATGKSTEELTHSKNPITKKRAIFAQNARKWKKKEDGGAMEYKDGGRISKEYIEKARKKPGGSNVGKKTFSDGSKRTGPYAGPAGGAPKGSYPIPDLKHAKAAIKLSGHAPNPGGVKAAVYRKYPQLKPGKKFQGGILGFRCGGILKQTATADSTKYYSKKLSNNMEEHFSAANKADKDLASKKVAQTKANLARQANKGKPGYDKNGFPLGK